jgi:hypothetical protein
LLVLARNSICACEALGRPILALEVDPYSFDEVLKPLLDAELGKIVVWPIFNLDDDFPMKKITIFNLNSFVEILSFVTKETMTTCPK